MPLLGPYLVNYDGESWRRLTDEFKKQPADVRAQLLHDSLSLALAGHLQSVTALQVTSHSINNLVRTDNKGGPYYFLIKYV